MHQALSVRDIQWDIITKLAEERDAESRAALKVASRVGPFHEGAMAKLFAVLHVGNLEEAIAFLYKACNVGQYVRTVHVGSEGHTIQVDPRKLEEFVALLPNARRIVLHPVVVAAPFVLPILSPEDVFQSYVLVASNRPQPLLRDVMPTIDASGCAGVFTTNTRLALPADGTWSPEVMPRSVEYLYTQGIGGEYGTEIHLQPVEMIISADATVTVAFYPSTMSAAATFGRFLQANGEKLTGIQILWTSAEGQLLDDGKYPSASRPVHADSSRTAIGLNHTLALGVAACTKLESITIDLFVGSNATSTLEEQMLYLLALVQSAQHRTLRILSLVVRVHEDSEVYQYIQELAQLDWRAITGALAPATAENPDFLGIRFDVLGCSGFVAMDVETVLYEQLITGQRIPIPVQPHNIPLLAEFCR